MQLVDQTLLSVCCHHYRVVYLYMEALRTCGMLSTRCCSGVAPLCGYIHKLAIEESYPVIDFAVIIAGLGECL